MIKVLFRTVDSRFTESATLRIAGACCFVRTNSKALLRTIGRWRSTDEQDSTRSFRLNVTVRDECDAVPSEPHFRGLRHIVFASWRDGCFAVFDLLRREITATISSRCAEDTIFWNAHFLPIALGVLGPAINAVPVHCACLEANGIGLLVAGESGAGKSTMAVALAMRGMSLISDDWTYVTAERSLTLTAHGVHAPVKLLPDATAHFPALRAFETTIALNGELSYQVDPATALGAAVKSACRPSILVFLRRVQSGHARLSVLDASVALSYLMDGAERLPGELHEARANRQYLLGVLASLPCYLFQYSGSPHSGASALQSALSDLASGRSNDRVDGVRFTVNVPPAPDLLRRFVARPYRSTRTIGHAQLALETNSAALLRTLEALAPSVPCPDDTIWNCTVIADCPVAPGPRWPQRTFRNDDLTIIDARDVIALRHGAHTFICIDAVRRELLAFVDPTLFPESFADLVRAIVHNVFPNSSPTSTRATAL